MKKILILLMAIFYGCNMYSQSKGTFVLSVNGNYAESSSSSALISIQTSTEEKALDMGLSAGLFLSNHFEMGLGLDFYWSSEENRSLISEFSDGIIRPTQIEVLEIKSDAFIPNVYGTYYCKLANRLFFDLNLKVGNGKIKSKHTTAIGTLIISSGQDNSLSGTSRYENDYFYVGMRPQLNYFATKRLGLSFSFGQFQYSIVDWETESSNWIASFHPNYWSFGIKLKFDSGKEAQ
jgi:hypothetical protein